jgi:hypothetical protein
LQMVRDQINIVEKHKWFGLILLSL